MCCFSGAARSTRRFVITWAGGPDRLCQRRAFLPSSPVTVPVAHLREQRQQDRQSCSPHLRTGLMHPASLHRHSANGICAATRGSLRSRNTQARLLGNQIPQIIFPPALPHSVPARFQLTSMCLAGQLAAHAGSEQHVCCLASWLLLLLPADVGLLPLVGMAICFFFPPLSCKPSGNSWEFRITLID